MNDNSGRVSAAGFLVTGAASGVGVGAGADDDLVAARLPDCAAAGPAHNAISAKTATTLKLEVTVFKTGRWFVIGGNPGSER